MEFIVTHALRDSFVASFSMEAMTLHTNWYIVISPPASYVQLECLYRSTNDRLSSLHEVTSNIEHPTTTHLYVQLWPSKRMNKEALEETISTFFPTSRISVTNMSLAEIRALELQNPVLRNDNDDAKSNNMQPHQEVIQDIIVIDIDDNDNEEVIVIDSDDSDNEEAIVVDTIENDSSYARRLWTEELKNVCHEKPLVIDQKQVNTLLLSDDDGPICCICMDTITLQRCPSPVSLSLSRRTDSANSLAVRACRLMNGEPWTNYCKCQGISSMYHENCLHRAIQLKDYSTSHCDICAKQPMYHICSSERDSDCQRSNQFALLQPKLIDSVTAMKTIEEIFKDSKRYGQCEEFCDFLARRMNKTWSYDESLIFNQLRLSLECVYHLFDCYQQNPSEFVSKKTKEYLEANCGRTAIIK